jgi:formamidopyrimidine-DNA glycosylase
MPELPEVEATRQNLERWTKGRRLVSVWSDDSAVLEALAPLQNRRFEGWYRRGKQLAAMTDVPKLVVASHLGMTGRWVRDPQVNRPHVRVKMNLEGDATIAFIDTRRFGSVTLESSLEDTFEGLGPDARDEPLSPDALRVAMGLGRTPLKTRLMEQRRVAGLGNIAVIEAAYRARIHPHTPVGRVTPHTWAMLSRGIADHLNTTLDGCVGLDEYAYVSEGGENPFLIYGREGQPCPACGHVILRSVLAGRPTFSCPGCQPEIHGNRES